MSRGTEISAALIAEQVRGTLQGVEALLDCIPGNLDRHGEDWKAVEEGLERIHEAIAVTRAAVLKVAIKS